MLEDSMELARLKREFQARGLASRLGFGERPAVLVVDMIHGFTDPTSPLGSDMTRQVQATAHLLAAAQQAGCPIYLSTVEFSEDLSDLGTWGIKIEANRLLRRGTRAVEFDERLGLRGNERRLSKLHASCFHGTALAEWMHKDDIDTLLIAGCTTSGCVRATVVDASAYGFRPMVVEEAVGDRSHYSHVMSLFDMDAKYGDVVSLEAAEAYLRLGSLGQASVTGQ